MPTFDYVGVNGSRRPSKGTIEANSLRQARNKIVRKGYRIRSLSYRDRFTWREYLSRHNRPVSNKDLLLFTRYFGVLLKSGIPVVRALQILESRTVNLRLKKAIYHITNDIEGGLSLHEAFSKYPEIFSSMYLNLVKTGEESGFLCLVFEKLTGYLDKSRRVKGKVQSAMAYPVTIVAVGSAVTFFLIAFIVPRFERIFQSFHGVLPLPTRMMIQLSDMVRVGMMPGLVSLILLGFFLVKFCKTKAGKMWFDRLIISIPLLRTLVFKATAVRFASNLSILLKSGINISRSLEICVQSIENQVIAGAVKEAADQITGGVSISAAFDQVSYLPEMARQMIAVGDETGNLEEMLQNISEFYESEVDELVGALLQMIEPISLVVLGVLIGTIVISMFLPMFMVTRQLTGH